jgi:lipopolysaccharide transport system permease protein
MPDGLIHMQEKNSTESWTEIISPGRHLLDLRLAEVWRYRDLVLLFVKRDFVSQYKQTVLGYAWYIIQPVLTTFMFLIVFNKIANISTGQIPAVLFYMCSITIWNYFASCLTATSSVFTANAGIFGKVYFPRLVLPLSIVLSNIIKFAIQLVLLTVLIIYYSATSSFHLQWGWHYMLIPVIVLNMACMGLGAGIIISSLTTKYRDFAVLITFGVQLLMYVTPVAYPLSYAMQSDYKNFILFNPLSPMVESFRYAVFGVGIFDTNLFLYSIAFSVVALLAGIILFNKVERSFMDTV